MPLRLFVIKPVEAREQGHDHPVLDAILAQPEYLPDPVGLTKPLHLWRWRDLREFWPALRRCAAAAPARRGAGGADGVRPVVARPALALVGPAQDLHQGADPGDHARRSAHAGRPPPARALRARDDDDHLAGGLHHGPAVLLHRPRARHLRAGAEPEGLAGAQAERGGVRGHLHGRQRRASARDRAARPACTSSITGCRRTSRGCWAQTRPRRSATATCGCSASVGSWPRRGSTRWSTRAPSCERAACRSRRGSSARTTAKVTPCGSGSPRSACRSRCPGRSARRSCWTSTAAPTRWRCRAGCCPTTATGSRTCSSRRWRRVRRSWPPGCRGFPS